MLSSKLNQNSNRKKPISDYGRLRIATLFSKSKKLALSLSVTGTILLGAPVSAQTPVIDYGDAPDTYGTDVTAGNSSNNSDPVGAIHTIVSGIHLGANAPDAEADAATPLDGSGDGADEDGITLTNLTEGDSSYTIPAANISATGTGTVHAWVDFNQSGTFEPSEYTSVAVSSGTPAGDLTWSSITTGTAGDTYARFRFTSDTSINANTPGGIASNGEVEDYQVEIIESGAFSCPRGFYQVIKNQLKKLDPLTGNYINIGLPVVGQYNAAGYNPVDNFIYGYGYETGTSIYQHLVKISLDGSLEDLGAPTKVGGVGRLTDANSGDFDNNGNLWLRDGNGGAFIYRLDVTTNEYVGFAIRRNLNRAAELVYINNKLYGARDNTLYIVDLSNTTLGTRLPVTTVTVRGLPNGFYGAGYSDVNGSLYLSHNGRGDLYQIVNYDTATPRAIKLVDTIPTGRNDGMSCPNALPPFDFDFGDAPDTGSGTGSGNHETLLADNGPFHLLDGTTFLGSSGGTNDSDGFEDGIDDNNDATDDTNDDGVQLSGASLQGQSLAPGDTVNLDITTAGSGVLNAWIDWNGDGDFLDANEQVATDMAPTSNPISLPVNVPTGVTIGTTYARFRYSTDTGLPPTGGASNGEVEDYQVEIATSGATISGTLYEDTNRSDDLTGGEAPLPDNIEVILYEDSPRSRFVGVYEPGIDTIVDTTNTTGGNGGYSFTNVADGIYHIFVNKGDTDIPATFTLGTPNNLPVTVAGSDVTGFDFGFDSFIPLPGNVCELLVVNSSFEAPDVTNPVPAPAKVFDRGQINNYRQSDVPGWSTTASDSRIEIWLDGARGVEAFSGNQFAEINANRVGALYQDVATTPGTLLTWQFAHRGREGTDVINLNIGAPGATVTQTTESTDYTAWRLYQGTYLVPAGQTVTRFEFEAVSTGSGKASSGNFLDAIRFGPLCDHGDANTGYPVTRADGGAAHTNDGVTFLGANVFVELYGQPSALADGDDNATGDEDGNDDENGVTFTSTLDKGQTATINIVASVAAPLSAWVDFNQDGDWDDAGEQIFTDEPLAAGNNSLSFTIPASATAGNTYARFRISSQSGLAPTGIVVAGEVEDYLVQIIASDPNVLLVKRITAINGNTTTNGDDLAIYNQDDSNPYDDNKLDNPEPDPIDTDKWFDTTSDTSSGFLIGGINGGKVEPDDEIEYTVYFLSAGDAEAKNVLVCDRVPDHVSFIPTSFNNEANQATGGQVNSNRGILWFKDGNTESLTNDQDGDAALYFAPGVDPATVYPNVNCGGTNTNGAVVVNLGDLPNATAPGDPNTSYGYIRFRGKVK